MRPDLILLQEVLVSSSAELFEGLERIGLSESQAGWLPTHEAYYGSAIASRWSVRGVDDRWKRGAPWPELYARCVVDVDGLLLDVVSVHMPNGSNNGWKKIDAYEAIARSIAEPNEHPLIVGGDFNEPMSYGPDGSMSTFAEQDCDRDDLANTYWNGDPRPLSVWDESVRKLLDGGLGIHDAHSLANGLGEMPSSHRSGIVSRCLDHLLISSELTALHCDYLVPVMYDGVSDHAPLTCDLKPRRTRLRDAHSARR